MLYGLFNTPIQYKMAGVLHPIKSKIPKMSLTGSQCKLCETKTASGDPQGSFGC
jgi:hypothetical protein